MSPKIQRSVKKVSSGESKVEPEWLLGAPLHPMTMRQTIRFCEQRIQSRRPCFICFANVHVVVESLFNRDLRKALWAADAVVPDGMPLVWFLRFCGHRRQDRVYGPDFMLNMTKRAEQGRKRLYLYGSEPRVLGTLQNILQDRLPRLNISGVYSPPYRRTAKPSADRAHAQMINANSPDIVFIGLGAPKQEIWMWRNRKYLKAPVLAGVGAAFDFHSGLKQQAPRWMMTSGLEWLFRLTTEPRRLWKRYLFYNLLFLFLVFLQGLGITRLFLNANRQSHTCP